MIHPLVDKLISTICTVFEISPSVSEAQRVYLIADEREAKLVFDLLTSHGFSAKLYKESGASKIYVSMPKHKISFTPVSMAESESFAAAAKSIKEHLDSLIKNGQLVGLSEYSLSLANTLSNDKQITIHLISNQRQLQGNIPAAPPPINQNAAVNNATSRAQANSDDHDDIFSGPAVMNPIGIRRAKLMKIDENPDTLWKQLKLYVKGNALYSSMVLTACILGLIIFISLFVVSKAFLCPDFASMKDKNPPWYCTYKTDEDKQ